jgi:hypothetical protein
MECVTRLTRVNRLRVAHAMTTTTVEASQHESGLHFDESILGATNAMLIVQTPDAYIGDHVPTRAVT